jgi:ureidoacrylate peracid hydrolase
MLAEPDSIEIDWQKTAVIVVDMQNAFISKGGMFDLLGYDILPNAKIIEPIRQICSRARSKSMKVIYIAHVFSPDLREIGPESSFWYKSPKIFQEDPRWHDKFLIRGTWGADIIDQLKPQDDDILVEKPRFSAFFGTNLDVILKRYGVKWLLFVGCATNICVEASIRGAANLGYFPVLISDACASCGPAFTQDATIFNVKICFGWVANTEAVLKAMS